MQKSIRIMHRSCFKRPLPRKLSLCIHSTARNEHHLEELILFLAERGYVFKDPSEFVTATGNACFLSFDDNFRSWLRVLPILEKHDAPGDVLCQYLAVPRSSERN
jgi:peptidoglycan/xylan/chitin deacetylase (PgdA/CDA1 family)